MYTDDLSLLSSGSDEVQPWHLQPISGTPWEVPVPKAIISMPTKLRLGLLDNVSG